MIRQIQKSDIIKCVEIVTENWGTAPALRFHEGVKHAFRPGLEWPPEYLIYEDRGVVAGFAGMMPSWIMHNVWDLIWINVKKNYQGLSIGTKLTSFRLNEITKRGGTAVNLMTREFAFFERFGFEIAHEYTGGWYLMTLQIKEMTL